MITKFKLFENMSPNYILSLDELWNSYDTHFNDLYPDVKLRKRDTKSRCYYFRLDLPKILIGKEIELPVYDNNGNKNIKHGEIEDVWTRYSQGGFMAKWSHKLKINGKWYTLKNNNINISEPKTELEEKLDFFSSIKKYNL